MYKHNPSTKSQFKNICIDLEANNLLQPMLDFSSMPYKLRNDAELYCISLRDRDTYESVLLLPEKYLYIQAPVVGRQYYFTITVNDPDTGVPTLNKIVSHTEYISIDGDILYTEDTKHSVRGDIDSEVRLTSVDFQIEDGIQYNNLKKDLLTKEVFKSYLMNCETLIGHNIINYDLPVLYLFGILDYRIGYPDQPSTLFGREVTLIKDTLIQSKLNNPDRTDQHGRHALKAFGLRTGSMKGDYTDFSHYNWKMGIYCDQDTYVGCKTENYLNLEEDFDTYLESYSMEAKLADLQVRQEAFGFYFDKDLAEQSIEELTLLLQNCKEQVEPHLPKKKLNKGEQAFYTPPKNQFKKNGELAAAVGKFITKIDAELIEQPSRDDPDNIEYFIKFNDKLYKLPCTDPVLHELPTSIKDGNVVKEYLIQLGWEPSEWNVRDLTKDSKKNKCTHEKIIANIERYLAETEDKGLFKNSRYKELGLDVNKDSLREYLFKKYKTKPNSALKVFTTPPLRVGADKSLCPNLLKLSQSMGEGSYIQFIVDFHTYSHRKNSIAGGDTDEDGNPSKGFISFVREDGRIGTPADTLGAATGRYLHRNICNIPRGSSVYGKNMRGMFGCGPGLAQLGYDFSSLENRAQAHFILDFEGGKELAKALLADKPNDIHCYSEDTEILTTEGWKTFGSLNKTDKVAQWNEGSIEFVLPTDYVWQQYKGEMISIENDNTSQLITPNHRVILQDTFTKLTTVKRADYFLNRSFNGIYKLPKIGNLNLYSSKYKNIYDSELKFKSDILTTFTQQDVSSKPYEGYIGCVSVPSGFVVVKRNDKVFVSGNTLNGKKLGLSRSDAKSVTYALLYGAAAPKLKKMLGLTDEEAEKLWNDFWDAVPPLKELRDKVTAFWKATDESYIPGIDGRKLRVRKEHSLINTLFQSAGALLVKWSVVRTAQLMEEQNILGDPFLHTTTDKKVFQMIVYHKLIVTC